MNHHLLYDAGCSRCAALATEIESVAEGRLGIRSLRDAEVTTLLDQHAPNHRWEPLVLQTNGDKVRVYGGLAMRVKLVQVLGIRKALDVARLVIKADGPVLGFEPKWFRPMMTTLGLGALFSFFGFGSGGSNLVECVGKVCDIYCSVYDQMMCQNLCFYPDGTEFCMGGWNCEACP